MAFPQRQVVDYRDQLAPDGLRRFLDRGAWFSDAHYGHAFTVTAAGHATMLTGAYPAPHRHHRQRLAQPRDRRARVLHRRHALHLHRPQDQQARRHQSGEPEGGDRGRRAQAREPRLEGDRASRARTAARSCPRARRAWRTCTWRRPGNSPRAPSTCRTIPRGSRRSTPPSPRTSTSMPSGSRSFPTRPTRSRCRTTRSGSRRAAACRRSRARAWTSRARSSMAPCCARPFGDALTLDFARAAIRGENLGADDVPDILSVSLSTHDYVNHGYGAESRLSHDHVLQLDRLFAGVLPRPRRDGGQGQLRRRPHRRPRLHAGARVQPDAGPRRRAPEREPVDRAHEQDAVGEVRRRRLGEVLLGAQPRARSQARRRARRGRGYAGRGGAQGDPRRARRRSRLHAQRARVGQRERQAALRRRWRSAWNRELSGDVRVRVEALLDGGLVEQHDDAWLGAPLRHQRADPVLRSRVDEDRAHRHARRGGGHRAHARRACSAWPPPSTSEGKPLPLN